MRASEMHLLRGQLFPKLNAASSLEQPLELTPEEVVALTKWIREEKYRHQR